MSITTVHQIEIRLYDLIVNRNDAFAALIKGEWGTGKTYFWKSFVEKYLQKKQVAYISLYGHQSIQDIKTEILLQIAPGIKKINWVQDKVKHLKGTFKIGDENVSVAGGVFSALLSVLKSSDFKEVVICFDDFERISSKLDLKDVLGLIAMLKEQKKCKIIMILNDRELADVDKLNSRSINGIFGKEAQEVSFSIDGQKLDAIFKKYHDKTVDHEYVYNPSINDTFELVKADLKGFDPDIFLKLLIEHGINNIRVMKRIVNDINEFAYLRSSNYDKGLLDGILDYVFSHSARLEKTNGYYRVQHGHSDTRIQACIDQYFENRFVNKNQLQDALQSAQANLDKHEAKDQIRKLHEKRYFDFSYTPKQFVDEAFRIFQTLGDNLVNDFGYAELKNYFDLFIELDPDNELVYREYLFTQAKTFLEALDIGSLENNYIEFRVLSSMEQDPELHDIIQQRKEDYYSKNKASLEEIIDLMRHPQEKNGWGNEQTKGLSSISSRRFEELMMQSAEFVKEAYYFVKFTNGFSGEKPFAEARKNIIEAFESIAKRDVRAMNILKEIKIEDK